MKKRLRFLQWFFAVICIIGGIGMLPESIAGGFVTLLFGVSLCPKLWELLNKRGVQVKKPLKYSSIILLFLLMVFSVPAAETEKTAEQETVQEDLAEKKEAGDSKAAAEMAKADTAIQNDKPAEADQEAGKSEASDFSEDEGTDNFTMDGQGTVSAVNDGKTITWNREPDTSGKAGAAKEDDLDKDTGAKEDSPEQNTGPAEDSAKQEAEAEGNGSNQDTAAEEDSSGQDTKAAEEPQNAETVNDNTSTEVHITNTGKKYHSAGCQYLRQSDIVTTLENAKAKGLGPCSKCNPPR